MTLAIDALLTIIVIGEKMSDIIYFADLTHTGSITNADVFPLGIGSVMAYAKKVFGDDLDCEIFKFPDELNGALEHRKPDLLCVSNYAWNSNLSLAFANHVKEKYPEVVVVMGGPNISLTSTGREAFLRKHSALDFYVVWEGEYTFGTLLKRLMNNGYNAAAIRQERVVLENCLYIDNGNYVEGPERRIENFMDIPSPYTMGLFDKFFSQGLRPIIETVRGCPYSCTFCNESHPHHNKTTHRTKEFISDELEYIANHIQHPVDLLIADDNFGMYKEDIEAAHVLRSILDTRKWPKRILGTVGKSHPERVWEAVSIINGGEGILQFGASIQSTDNDVLTAIKRKNLPIASLLPRLKAAAEKGNTELFTEIILALPEDTKEKHFSSLRESIDVMGMDIVNVHQLTLLQGAPMALDEQREKYGFESRFRVFVGCIGVYKFGNEEKPVAEYEEVVIANSTMTFEEWIDCRIVSLLVKIYIDRDGFIEIFGLLRRLGLSSLDVLIVLKDNFIAKYPKLSEITDLFVLKTKEPLHESLEELTRFTSSQETVDKFTAGELGGNELLVHRAKANLYCYDELHMALRDATLMYLDKNGLNDDEMTRYVEQAIEFSRLHKFNFANYEKELEGRFSYDFITAAKEGFRVLPNEIGIPPARIGFFFDDRAKDGIKYAIRQWLKREGTRTTRELYGSLQVDSDIEPTKRAQLEFNLGKLFHYTNWKVVKRTPRFV